MLVRSGCDPSIPDTRQQRTPLMLACLMRNDAIAQLLIQLKVNLTAADRLGNTALMYAAIYGQASVVALLVNELTRRWSFDVFRAKNVMGYTAEALAKKNGRYECSRLLKRERLHMLQRMHRQLALIHLSASLKGWNNYGTVYKAKQAFLSGRRNMAKRAVSNVPRTTTKSSVPIGAKDNRSSRVHCDNVFDGVRKYRSVGEGDFRELTSASVHLPPIQAYKSNVLRPMKKIGGSVEFPSITSTTSH
uniref:ANK_REP_REGION domain-containing protein n=1 Tax=Parascaris univalens TaxID=6257 RepID=A0A915CAI5_PARUN